MLKYLAVSVSTFIIDVNFRRTIGSLFGREYETPSSRPGSRRNSILPRRASMISGDSASTMERRNSRTSATMPRRASLVPSGADTLSVRTGNSPQRYSILPPGALAVTAEETYDDTLDPSPGTSDHVYPRTM